jgi:Ran GTPase-activating protein (RanGAP) involved in mRNA processing and transport
LFSQHPNNKLNHLSISGNDMGAEAGTAIAEALKASPGCIGCYGRCFSSTSWRCLNGSQHLNNKLSSLDLGNNHLGAEGGKAMAEALKVNFGWRTYIFMDIHCIDLGYSTRITNSHVWI